MEQKIGNEIKIPSIFRPCFENVPGMNNLKIALTNMYNIQQVNKKRLNLGLSRTDKNYRNNLLIVGPSGSGKTTAVGIVGECYEKLGLVSDRDPIVTDYQTFLSVSSSKTVENVRNIGEKALDRILLIDHLEDFDDDYAYSPGFAMIDQIVDIYNSSNGRITLIVTGEEKAVREILKKKRNLADLFDLPMVVLGEYSESDLALVAHRIAKSMGYILDPDVDKVLITEYRHQKNIPDFNYLNMFKDMIVEASMNAASRVAKIHDASDIDVSLIKAEDFNKANTNIEGSESLEDMLNQLNSLIGLSEVKEQVNSIITSIKMAKLEAEAGITLSKGTMHMIFSGAPGTGKTTVARLIGKIYAHLGVLSKGQLVECSRQDLVADIVGGTAKQTHAKIEEALGGVLFIDEAYSLVTDKRDSFGIEALNTLTADIYNYKDDLLVILAGYEKEMNEFLAQNPGMKSRIPHIINFKNYTVEEMILILKKYIDESGMILEPDAEETAKNLLENRSKESDFGNARGVENVFNEIVRSHQKRLSSLKEEFISVTDIKTITREDIDSDMECPQKHSNVQEWYDELDSLTGLQGVKDQIKQMTAKVKVNQIRKERGLPTQGIPSLHMVFKGSAGTGKTTVARLIGNIYKGLGVLTTGKVVECTRSDIVGEYQGQTAVKIRKKIKEAQGGILFIDEVYSLCNGRYDSFGMEAINELVPAMENYRDNFMVIVAGYTEQMDSFMASNQGLRSRFSNEFIFEDFSKEELIEIFFDMLDSRSLTLSDEEDAHRLLDEIITKCSEKIDFGNARGIRNLIEKLTQIQECRVAGMLVNDTAISDEEIQMINCKDLTELYESL